MCNGCVVLPFALERIQNSSKRNPVLSNCCQNGKFVPPSIYYPPLFRRGLFEGSSTASYHFLMYIKSYKTAFSRASVFASSSSGCAEDSGFNPTSPFQGRIYHEFGFFFQQPVTPAFPLIYIFDSELDHQTGIRVCVIGNLNRENLRKLIEMMQFENPYVQTFLSPRDWAVLDETLYKVKNFIDADRKPTSEHSRSHNIPKCLEVAAVMPGVEDGWIEREILVFKKDSRIAFARITFLWHTDVMNLR